MRPDEDIQQLKRVIQRVVPIPEAEWQAFSEHLEARIFEKGDYPIRAGDVSSSFFFVVRGLLRFFYLTSDGKEFNKHFVMENGFAGSYHSLVRNEPCGFYVQALARTEVVVMPHGTMTAFYHRHPCWERLGRINAEQMFLFKEAREKELLLDPLETRYLRFLENFPGLAERVPQYHIASYLGVTDVALSRIRKKLFR